VDIEEFESVIIVGLKKTIKFFLTVVDDED
jgi:hypothetical protein